MTIDKMRDQIIRWATEAGASKKRAEDYGARAIKAISEIEILAPDFVNAFNSNKKNGGLSVNLDKKAVSMLVLAYNREMINLKKSHKLSLDDRIDTHICAGLWFCCIAGNPIFGCDDNKEAAWDMANIEQLTTYHNLLCNFAFYFSFRVLRGHYDKYEETYLLSLLTPLRKYIADHFEEICKSYAAMVGLFLTISLFEGRSPPAN